MSTETDAVTLHASSAGDELNITAAGTITTAGDLSGDNVNLSTTANGSITLGDDITATTDVTLSAHGTGAITQTQGKLISTGELTMTSGSGAIGSAANAIDTTVAGLTASTAGTADIFVNETDAVTLHASSAGDELNLTAGGAITTDGALSADDLTLTTGANGNLTLGANLTGTTSANLTAHGSGNIAQTAGTISGGALTMTSTTGNIGTSVNALDTDVASIAANTGGTADIFISEANAVTLHASSAGDELNITAAGTITTAGDLSGDNVNLSTTANGSITLGDDITATTDVTLAAHGTGAITQTQGKLISTGELTMTSTTGNIGTSVNALDTDVASIAANTGGTADIFISEANAVTLHASSAGDELNITAAGTITTAGDLSGDNVNLSTTANGSITLGDDITATTDVTLSAHGTGAITQTQGKLISTGELTMTSGTGSIGSSANAIDTTVAGLTASTAGTADIFVTKPMRLPFTPPLRVMNSTLPLPVPSPPQVTSVATMSTSALQPMALLLWVTTLPPPPTSRWRLTAQAPSLRPRASSSPPVNSR